VQLLMCRRRPDGTLDARPEVRVLDAEAGETNEQALRPALVHGNCIPAAWLVRCRFAKKRLVVYPTRVLTGGLWWTAASALCGRSYCD
jgi:hypothetical protein